MEESTKEVRPWDIFNKNVEKVENEVLQKRLSICMVCPEFIKLTSTCKQCGCFMKSKAKMSDSVCPLGKWHKINVSFRDEE